MNTDNNKLILVGIGASLAAAYCTYKFTKTTHKKRRVRAHSPIRDVEGCFQNGLSDVDITILNGEECISKDEPTDKITEASVPLSWINFNRQKQIIQGQDVESVTSSEITNHVAPNRQNLHKTRHVNQVDEQVREWSIDSEEERFQKWQKEREQHLNTNSYIKNDKICSEEQASTAANELTQEKKKLNRFIRRYKKDRMRSIRNSKRVKTAKSHFSEANRSLSDLCQTEVGSVCDGKSIASRISKKSRKSEACEEVQKRGEDNFFDIFLTISQPIVEDTKLRRN